MIEILHPHDDRTRVDELTRAGYHIVDTWPEVLPELQALELLEPSGWSADEADLDSESRYVVYPWRHAVVRVPDSSTLYRLRTARNRFLITGAEQARWAESVIAVAGLSVGASLLNVCALTGGRNFRIADPDVLGPTNLNRLAGSVCDLGVPKATLATRRLLETDPYCTVEAFDAGFAAATAKAFLGDEGQRTDIVLEEVDNIAMKVEIRKQARARGIPVVMVTDNGDDVILDVERYDLDGTYPLFHGRAGQIENMSTDELTDPANRLRLAGAIAGDDVTPRMSEALTEVGKSIPSWPQLGTAATLAGAVGALVARQIVCGYPVASGRRHVRIDSTVGLEVADSEPEDV